MNMLISLVPAVQATGTLVDLMGRTSESSETPFNIGISGGSYSLSGISDVVAPQFILDID